jgi:hypothetical protein
VKLIIDTNVPLVANKAAPQAGPSCVLACVKRITEIQNKHTVVLDDQHLILREYRNKLSSAGQPGVGDAFLKWVLTNLKNPHRCEHIHITQVALPDGSASYEEFPTDPDIATFDVSDRKFVAVSLAHPERPPILNAVDSDWWIHLRALKRHGVTVEFVCGASHFSKV